jgi:hypothetical protein
MTVADGSVDRAGPALQDATNFTLGKEIQNA